jgi:ribulose-phosphate 3-epimerase
MILIKASILAADYSRLGDQAAEAEAAGADAIQIDVMDGRFVPDITFGPGVVKAVRSRIRVKLEADLMIVEPEKHIEAFVSAGADRVIVHREACVHPHRILGAIRELGAESGLALAPGTPVDNLNDLLSEIDFLQIMTVNPGWGGQKFIRSQLEKIRQLNNILAERGFNIPIGVDGGIDLKTAVPVARAGATELVAGSAIYNDRASVAKNIEALRKNLESL